MAKNMLKDEDLKPEVEPFAFWLEAFSELSTCRQIGFGGAGPIPFSAIVEYTRVYDIEDFEEFIYVIRRMDNEYLLQSTAKEKANGTTDRDKSNKNKHSLKR